MPQARAQHRAPFSSSLLLFAAGCATFHPANGPLAQIDVESGYRSGAPSWAALMGSITDAQLHRYDFETKDLLSDLGVRTR